MLPLGQGREDDVKKGVRVVKKGRREQPLKKRTIIDGPDVRRQGSIARKRVPNSKKRTCLQTRQGKDVTAGFAGGKENG